MFSVPTAATRLRLLACATTAAMTTLCLAPTTAQGAAILGSGSIFTSRPCPAASDAACVVSGVPRTFTQFNGDYGTGLTASATSPTGDTYAARVGFTNNYLPVIGVASHASDGTRVGSSATGFRSYTYTGAAAIDLALKARLHYVNSSDSGVNDAFGEGHLNAMFGIMSLADFAGYDMLSGVDFISLATASPLCGEGALAAAGGGSTGTSGNNNVTIELAQTCAGDRITLHQGDEFVIVATLQAISNRGGFIDAMHTFEVQFDEENTFLAGTNTVVDPQQLHASIERVVPEPSTWAMLLAGFGGLGAMLRRRRTASAAG